jgi:transcriptional regulator with XRE-family HTH domain
MSPPTQDPKRLRRERIKAGLNRRELAAAVGIHKTYMGRLERGLGSASPRLLKRFAEFFGCAIEDLMPPEPDDDSQAGAA